MVNRRNGIENWRTQRPSFKPAFLNKNEHSMQLIPRCNKLIKTNKNLACKFQKRLSVVFVLQLVSFRCRFARMPFVSRFDGVQEGLRSNALNEIIDRTRVFWVYRNGPYSWYYRADPNAPRISNRVSLHLLWSRFVFLLSSVVSFILFFLILLLSIIIF
jgi:hypothetical protein